MKSIKGDSACKFEPKGSFDFKNIAEQKQVFEVITSSPDFLYVDPVCRMLITSLQDAVQNPSLPDVYFCSDSCLALHESRYIQST